MPYLHHVRLQGPPEAHPETAAIRFIALLPATWQATLTGCHGAAAHLQVTVPPATTATERTRTFTAVLADPGLQNWHCTFE